MAVHHGGRGPGHTSRWTQAATSTPTPAPSNSVAPSIEGDAYVGETVVLALGTWADAVTFRIRVRTDEVAPVTLLDWTAATGSTDWTLPAAALDKSLVLSVEATGPGGQATEDSVAFGPVDAYAPSNLIPPEVLGGLYAGTDVLLDLGEWDNAVSYEVRVQTDEGSPVTLLAYTSTVGGYTWTMPDTAIGKSVILTVRATGVGGDQVAEASSSFGTILAPVAVVDSANISASATAVTTGNLTWSHVVRQGPSRTLFVAVSMYGADTDTVSGVTYNGVAMTAVAGSGTTIHADGTREVIQVLYALRNPSVGTADVVVSRTGSLSVRFYATAFVVEDIAEVAVATATTYFSATDTTSYTHSSPASATAAHQFAILVSSQYILSASNTTTLGDSFSAISSVQGSGADSRMVVGTRALTAAGSVPASTTISGTGARNQGFLQILFQAVPHVDVPPTYYFDPATGNDANDGSVGSPFKSLDKIAAIAPLAAGTNIILKGGARHRFATKPALGTPALDVTALGSAGSPVTISTHDGTKAYICGDEIKTGWASASSGETNAVAAAAGAEKLTLGAFSSYPQLSPAFIDNTMLQPAYWHGGGYGTSIHDWALSVEGSDSYTHLPAADIQDSESLPAAFDGTSIMQCKYVSGTWTVRVVDPAIAAHYGAVSPVGGLLVFKSANIQKRCEAITAYDQGGSWIEVSYVGDTNRGPEKDSGNYWNVLCHPFDLRETGQFARIGNDIFCLWPAGTTKSVSAVTQTLRLRGTYIDMQDIIEVSRCAKDYGGDGTESIFELGGSNHVINEIWIGEGINPANPPCLGVMKDATPLSDTSVAIVRTRNARNHSGVRINKGSGGGNTFGVLDLQELGRTGFYCGGSTQDVEVDEVHLNGHCAPHGNGITSYQQSRDIRVNSAIITDAPIALTSQVDSAHARPPGKSNQFRRGFFAGQRGIGPSPYVGITNTPLVRIDGGDSDTVFEDLWSFGAYSTAMSWNGSGSNLGASITRAAMQSLTFATDGGDGMDLTNVMAVEAPYNGGGVGGAEGWDTNGGATLVDSDVDLTATVYPISDAMWDNMTDTGAGHGSQQIGPPSLGWTIPAYGGTITLVDLALVSPILRGTWQAYRAIGVFTKLMPKSAISLPAGVTDNDDFEIDECYLVPKIALPAGSYSVTVRETNASASNGPTRDTVVPITVT